MNPIAEPAWEIKDLVFSYSPKEKRGNFQLQISDWTIASGQKVFLQGRSGSGKSTLLELLGGVVVPNAGSVRVLGQRLSELPLSVRDHWRGQHLGFIFQSLNLLPALTVWENIALAKTLGCRSYTNEDLVKICQRLGIQEVLDRKPHEVSIGQAQRAAVARALLGSPQILFADEPTSALDREHQELFIELLIEMATSQAMTLLFVSHDLTLQTHFDQVWSIDQGKLVRIR